MVVKKKKTPSQVEEEKNIAVHSAKPDTTPEKRSDLDLSTKRGQEKEAEAAAFTGVPTSDFIGGQAGLIPAETFQRAEQLKEQAAPLKEELTQKATPGQEPSLESPLSLGEKGAAIALTPTTFVGNTISSLLGIESQQNAADLAQTKFGKGLALGLGGTAGALAVSAGAAGVGLVVAGSAKVAIGAAVAGAGATLLNLGGKIVGFGDILDLNRGEINEMKSVADGMTITGERAQALAINSPQDIPFVIGQLEQMNDDLNFAESKIQQKSISNFRYAGSSEYFTDQIAFRNARLAILRRLEAVENIAITGAASGNLDEFIIGEAQFSEQS